MDETTTRIHFNQLHELSRDKMDDTTTPLMFISVNCINLQIEKQTCLRQQAGHENLWPPWYSKNNVICWEYNSGCWYSVRYSEIKNYSTYISQRFIV